MTASTLTPLMRQYFAIKQEHPDTMLLFQVGDFYELFFDDAITAASVLGIALTKRGTHNGEPIPLCGVPLHVKQHYFTKLVKAGYKVALCDQLESAQPGKIVERGITQVLTPGTLTDSVLLEDKTPSYLLAVYKADAWQIASVELMTGHLFVTVLDDGATASLEAELARYMPDEVLISAASGHAGYASFIKKQGYYTTALDASDATILFDAEQWFAQVCNQKEATMALQAVQLLYSYLHKTNERALQHIKQCTWYQQREYVMLDAATQRNLELVANNQDGSERHTLFAVLDRAMTPMGSRMLKKWLVRPLTAEQRIADRHDLVDRFVQDAHVRTALNALLTRVGDLERIVGRIALRRAHLHDYQALSRVLRELPDIKRELSAASSSALGAALLSKIHEVPELAALLSSALNDDTSHSWSIAAGYDERLDEVRRLVASGAKEIEAFEAREQQRTGISSLKIKYNGVHGYGIEVTKPNLGQVPDDYVRTQTLAQRERFSTPELKELEYKLTHARAQSGEIEQALYEEVKAQVENSVPSLKKTAHALAYIDSILSFATCAHEYRYVRPTMNHERRTKITQGRHPVVEQRVRGSFIPNDVHLDQAASLWLITGPNMGGKSTFLRQVALTSLMAQIGSFVPAQSADIGFVDRIFTRIGASDNVAEGKSTFLVEMEETALICSQATADSLVILDEVGRGTSTFDGLAIAQAVVEYVYSVIKARCLFATHYHELTTLCTIESGIKPFYAASSQSHGSMILLHKILPGVADGSFGLDVAALAKLPASVIDRARALVEQLRTQELSMEHRQPISQAKQAHTYEKERFVAAQVAKLDCDALSPKQALELLWKLQAEYHSQ